MKDIDIVLKDQENARVLLTAFQTMLDNTTDMIFVKDIHLKYLGVSLPFVNMIGMQSVEEIIGRKDADLFEDAALAAQYVAGDWKLLASGKNMIDFVEPLPDDHGKRRYAATSKYVLKDGDGKAIGVMGVSRDITKEVLAEEQHRRELEYLFTLPKDAYVAVFVDVYEWRIIGERRQDVNGVAFPLNDSLEGIREDALRYVAEESSARTFYEHFSGEYLQTIFESGKRNLALEYLRTMQDGTPRWVRTEVTLMSDPVSGHLRAMVVIRDIHTQKQEEQKILLAAEKDEMTGVLNRSATMKYIQGFLQGDGKHGTHALLVIDIDNFKEVNDTYGHQRGDRLLVQLAQSIQKCFRSSDLIGRIGGDEFFVLMKNVPSKEKVREKSHDLLNAMCTVCATEGDVQVSGSIGIGVYSEDNQVTLQQLYEQADIALYQAKRAGKNCAVFFSES